MDDTFERAWRVVSVLPERELTMMPSASIAASYHGSIPTGDASDSDEGTKEPNG
jgi:hypothetical protein